MFAGVSTFEGALEQVDELTRYADEQVFPALRDMDGFAGAFGLAAPIRSRGSRSRSYTFQTQRHPELRFSATLGQELEVELALV
jgi:hypothetical protein